MDSMLRYKYFSEEQEWENYTHTFVMHALFMLKELKAEEALGDILKLLRQDEEFLDFWFGDIITEYMWMIIFATGMNRLEELKEFVIEEGNNNLFARGSVSSAVCQLALYYPELSEQIISWYDDVFRIFINEKENDKPVDAELIGLMICDAIELKSSRLEPVITELFENEIVDKEMTGEIDGVLRDMTSKNFKSHKYKIETLNEIYKDLARIEKIQERVESKFSQIEIDRNEKIENDLSENKYRNVGRNEKCPCGSGLKYKKCHGKN